MAIVFLTVVLNHHSGLGECPELLAVEAFIAKATVETLYKAILPRTTGLNVSQVEILKIFK